MKYLAAKSLPEWTRAASGKLMAVSPSVKASQGRTQSRGASKAPRSPSLPRINSSRQIIGRRGLGKGVGRRVRRTLSDVNGGSFRLPANDRARVVRSLRQRKKDMGLKQSSSRLIGEMVRH